MRDDELSVMDHAYKVRSQTSGVKRQEEITQEVKPQEPKVRIKRQESNIRRQETGVKLQESNNRKHTSIIKRQAPDKPNSSDPGTSTGGTSTAHHDHGTASGRDLKPGSVTTGRDHDSAARDDTDRQLTYC